MAVRHKAAATLPYLIRTLRKEPQTRPLPSLRRAFSLYDQINLIDNVPEDQLRFQRYTDTGFTVNAVEYEGSVICLGNLLMSWSPKKFSEINSDRQGVWFSHANMASQMGIINGMVPSLICWEIWKSRCKARYEDKAMAAGQIIQNVGSWLQCLMPYIKCTKSYSFTDSIALQALRVAKKNMKFRPLRVVRWMTPLLNTFTLNTDGSSRDSNGLCGGGGFLVHLANYKTLTRTKYQLFAESYSSHLILVYDFCLVSEILILGCGRHVEYVDPELRRFIRSTGMKLEVIDSVFIISLLTILYFGCRALKYRNSIDIIDT
ncbi:hypothetical protein GIB67_015304 [Kingdonia uniflora]|uniref:Uncharacterized protein n=1 Tax=Kingdonia uniflora TaxID=39325 RepID=A0A7J7KYL0_9MAGN|nr:hypothetical protein GIB67_015304 [Kingdonia uniflora]